MTNSMRRLASFLLSKNLRLIELFLLMVCLLAGYLNHLLSVEFQPDETFWIVSSVRLDKLMTGEFDSPIWTEEPFISFEVRPLPSYIVAVSQRLGGVQPDSLPVYWDWSLSKEENIVRGAMPSARLLWLSRLPMAFISAISILGIIFLLAKSQSRFAAYLFAIISFNEYFLLHLRRAMSEAPLLLFTVLVMYSSYKLLSAVENSLRNRIILWSILTGMFSGFAAQSKLTGWACAGIAILGSGIVLSKTRIFSNRPQKRILFIVTFFVACTSLLVFFISYPFFYENTIHRMLATFYMRSQVVEAQMNLYPNQIIPSKERIAILFQRIFQYPLNVRTSSTLDTIFHWINLLLAAFGLSHSIKQVWMKQKGEKIQLVLVLSTLVCAVPMLFVPLDWDRYYLYPVFFSCIFFTAGMSQLFALLVSRMEMLLSRQSAMPEVTSG